MQPGSASILKPFRITGNIILWSAVIALSAYFFLDNVYAFVLGYRSDSFGETFFNNQFWVVLHLIGGTLTLLLGPLQFWKFVRNRYLSFHRLSGKIYIIGALSVGLSALRLSLVSDCVSCRISLFILAVLLLMATVFAWMSIKNKNIQAHQNFMIRSYVAILSFVFVRVEQIIPLNFLFGTIEDSAFNRTVNEYFFSFVPLLVTEILITWIPSLRSSRSRKLTTTMTNQITV